MGKKPKPMYSVVVKRTERSWREVCVCAETPEKAVKEALRVAREDDIWYDSGEVSFTHKNPVKEYSI